MLRISQAVPLNFAYTPIYIIPITLYHATLHRYLLSLKSQINKVHLLGSKQDNQSLLPMGLSTNCMPENSQAVHLTLEYIYIFIFYQ